MKQPNNLNGIRQSIIAGEKHIMSSKGVGHRRNRVTKLKATYEKSFLKSLQLHYFAAATSAALARVKAAISDPSCNLSLHAKLNLYLYAKESITTNLEQINAAIQNR